ncbi:MAG: HD domain-containing protein [Saprospiraceae bacterium]|nr:HD domain-containing protein [Saprospiraceae bacterium]MBP7679464.1 HD domain-containing protein [Saprospiraceae bacterium]
MDNNTLTTVSNYVTKFFEQSISKDFVFHDFQHTLQVVSACKDIAAYYDFSEREWVLLQVAAWFHDTGYDQGATDHEERSAKYVEQYLQGKEFNDDDINIVKGCIMATKMPQSPKTTLEEIICDADMSHLGKSTYWDRCSRLRQELNITRGKVMDEQSWIDFEIDFMNQHDYHTEVARTLYNPSKKKYTRQLEKQRKRLNPDKYDTVELDDYLLEKPTKEEKAVKEKLEQHSALEQIELSRGVETMFRSLYRTHLSISAQADTKAHIMLSINAIVISVAMGTLIPKCKEMPILILPTAMLFVVCLVSYVFATLSTRPKVTEGKVSREDITQRRSNLLFFGNFYNMKLEDFQWGMKEMMRDNDFLYNSMTRDLYFLGKVLAKKYNYLSICYNVFMYGLIAAVIAFAIAFAIS